MSDIPTIPEIDILNLVAVYDRDNRLACGFTMNAVGLLYSPNDEVRLKWGDDIDVIITIHEKTVVADRESGVLVTFKAHETYIPTIPAIGPNTPYPGGLLTPNEMRMGEGLTPL